MLIVFIKFKLLKKNKNSFAANTPSGVLVVYYKLVPI